MIETDALKRTNNNNLDYRAWHNIAFDLFIFSVQLSLRLLLNCCCYCYSMTCVQFRCAFITLGEDEEKIFTQLQLSSLV